MEYEIDYEDMDDLALSDHIEWNHDQTAEFTMDALENKLPSPQADGILR